VTLPSNVLSSAVVLAVVLAVSAIADDAPVVRAVGASDAAAAESSIEIAVFTDKSSSEASQVRPVSYSTGPQGHKLKWLPVRRSGQQAGGRPAERTAEYTSQSGPEPVRAAGGPDPFTDPFDDAGGKVAQREPLSPPSRLFDFDLDRPDEEQKPAPSRYEPLPLEEEILEAESSEESQRIGESELEKTLKGARREVALDECPTLDDLKRIHQLRYKITPPDDKLPEDCSLEETSFEGRCWAPITFTWKASGLCHKPVYFEDVHLERYGHSWGCIPQPLFSAAHFFVNVPVLPYAMGLCPPKECVYTLGYYRPGNCAPYMLDPLPLSVRAGLFEAGAWVGGVFAIP
jgi:hypothetical protein